MPISFCGQLLYLALCVSLASGCTVLFESSDQKAPASDASASIDAKPDASGCDGPCDVGKACNDNTDCASDQCWSGECVDLSASLVAYWAMEQADGTEAPDGTGRGNHLSLPDGSITTSGDNPQVALGKVGNAAGFSGAGYGRYFWSIDKPDLNFAGDFTLALWANTDNADAPYDLAYYVRKVDEFRLLWRDAAPPSSPFFPSFFQADLLSTGDSLLAQASMPEGSVVVSTWQFLIARRSGSDFSLTIYDDNNGTGRVVIDSLPGVGAPLAGKPFVLGSATDGYPLQGTIDEVGKWSRALSDVECSALYNLGAGRTLPFGTISGP